MHSGYRVCNAIMSALAQVVPEQRHRQGFDTTRGCSRHLSDARLPRLSRDLRRRLRGIGDGDGCDAVEGRFRTAPTSPIESLDLDYDFFRIVGYELAPNSFGLGARRGGAGFMRRCEILRDDVQLAIYSDRFRLAPEGLLGGEPGQRGYCRIFRANGTVEDLRSKAAVDLAKGDIVEMFVGGGAGFGRVSERPTR